MQHVLLRDYGNATVTVSSANTFSHSSRNDELQEYIDSFSVRDPSTERANESFYLFGPHGAFSPRLKGLVEQYTPPPFAGKGATFSFGIGADATGIPFHIHGHGFSEVIHGSKVRTPLRCMSLPCAATPRPCPCLFTAWFEGLSL
jgi:hypothetical protein